MTIKRSRKKDIEAAQKAYEDAVRLLRVHEKQWQSEWDSAKNPFEALKQYTSNKARAARKVIIDGWLKAASEWEAVRPKRSVVEQ